LAFTWAFFVPAFVAVLLIVCSLQLPVAVVAGADGFAPSCGCAAVAVADAARAGVGVWIAAAASHQAHRQQQRADVAGGGMHGLQRRAQLVRAGLVGRR
jgi:hypothetical protein